MNYDKKCYCKGIRRCNLCENNLESTNNSNFNVNSDTTYTYCIKCNIAFLHHHCLEDIKQILPFSETNSFIHLHGLLIVQNFITNEEENLIISEIDAISWVGSQSGRRKQDYGPKVNFKKQKINTDSFLGFPHYSKPIVSRLQNSVSELSDFEPVELCVLEYVLERGSSIDPHFDDTWLWGERLVTINLLSNCVYLMQKNTNNNMINMVVPLPARSLVVLSKEARHIWMHSIPRSSIQSRRIAITLRELSQQFKTNGPYEHIGNKMLNIAKQFIDFKNNIVNTSS